MNRIMRASLAGLTFLALGATGANAGDYYSSDVRGYQYAVKYVCGLAEEDVLIHTGDYRTAINVVNANYRRTVVRVAAVPTNDNGTTGYVPPAKIYGFKGHEIDCPDIRAILTAAAGSQVRGLIKGMVILQSCRRPIDVSAVYTTASEDNSPVVSSQVAAIADRKIDLSYEDCHVED